MYKLLDWVSSNKVLMLEVASLKKIRWHRMLIK